MLDWSKPIEIDGKPARRISDRRTRSVYKYVILIDDGPDECVAYASENGEVCGYHSRIVNVRQRYTGVVNVYREQRGIVSLGGFLGSPEIADKEASHGRIARIRVSFTEGQMDE